MINRIEIEGYKSFKKIDLELKPINILIGANGSGKSNFLTFFEFLNQLYNQNLRTYIATKGGADTLLHNGIKETSQLNFALEFNNTNNTYTCSLERSADEEFVFSNEIIKYRTSSKTIGIGINEAKLKNTKTAVAQYIGTFISQTRKYHFHDTSVNSPFTKAWHIEDNSFFLHNDGGNIAVLLKTILERKPKVYQRIVKTIQSIAPYFSDFYLKATENKQIRLRWTSKYSETVYNATNLSDGTLRFIALAVLFLQPTLPQTIIIDEPELGLHPFALYKLSGLIKNAASRDCQIILATQSAELISYFEPEDILTVDQIKGATELTRLDEKALKHWLEDYTIGELWQRSIINGGQPNE